MNRSRRSSRFNRKKTTKTTTMPVVARAEQRLGDVLHKLERYGVGLVYLNPYRRRSLVDRRRRK
jgi:hypothetical protein